MSPEYLLLSDNCYFYAGTIIKVLQERYMPRLEIETTGSRVVDEERGLGWKGKGKQKEKELKAGTWHHIEIYAGEEVETAPLKKAFDKGLKKFMKPVCFFFEHWFWSMMVFAFRFKSTRPKRKPRT
jgi:hypothetical protein